MRIRIDIYCDNAAFDQEPGMQPGEGAAIEGARILTSCAWILNHSGGISPGEITTLHDANGNPCGSMRVTSGEEAAPVTTRGRGPRTKE